MNKRVAPTVVMILVVFFILLEAGIVIFSIRKEGLGTFWTLLLLIIPIALIIALISVYVERIKEIDDQEKDDLSNY
jgi:hypothetical protein